jgi:tetratricopeptide (TPR) repeat protein
LARGVAEQVSLRLVAAGELIDADPDTALAHALVARRLASRIAAVREAVGLAAYRAGQWQTAIGELRAYHRMTGRQTHLAVLADCERALGRPERAIDMFRAADRDQMSPQEAIELLIVAAGARSDLGQADAAVTMLQVRELTSDEPWVARLRYAYADSLLAVGRNDEAREWFARAAEVDEDAQTDAAERLLELDGVVLDGDEDLDESDEDGQPYEDLATPSDDDESDEDEDEDDEDEDDDDFDDDDFDDDDDEDDEDDDEDDEDEDDEDDDEDDEDDEDDFDDEDEDDEDGIVEDDYSDLDDDELEDPHDDEGPDALHEAIDLDHLDDDLDDDEQDGNIAGPVATATQRDAPAGGGDKAGGGKASKGKGKGSGKGKGAANEAQQDAGDPTGEAFGDSTDLASGLLDDEGAHPTDPRS